MERLRLARDGALVFPRVKEDVDERVAHLARRREGMAMVAVAEERAATPGRCIHAHRDTREQLAHLRRQIGRVGAFDHQVQMVVLDRILEHAHVLRLGAGELTEDDAPNPLRAKARRERHAPDGDVHGML